MKDEGSVAAQDVLRLVRGSADPLPHDEARVLERVEQRLGLLSGLEASQRGSAYRATPRGRPRTGLGSAPIELSARALGLLPRLGLWAAMAASLAGIGYGVSKRERGGVPVLPASVAPAMPPAIVEPAARESIPPVAPAVIVAPAPFEAAPRPAASAPPPPARPRRSPPSAAAPARREAAAAPPAQQTPAVPASAGALSLREALPLLERAQAAVRLGTAGDALAWLDRLEQRAPGPLLEQERMVTRALALCALGEVSKARDLRARLERLDPQTIYRGQLDASCAKKD